MDPNFIQQELVLLANIHAQFQDCVLSPMGCFIGKPNEQLRQIMPGEYGDVPIRTMPWQDATTWWRTTTQQGSFGTNNTFNPRTLYTGGGM